MFRFFPSHYDSTSLSVSDDSDLSRLLLFNPQWLLYTGIYTTRLNIQKSYVLPTDTLFICFVWIFESKAIISLCNIQWFL